MMNRIFFLLGWLVGVLNSAEVLAQDLTAAQVADRIQRFYDSTKDFQAMFKQEYQSKALGSQKESSGFVYIKKPGMMRWDYVRPQAKHFVADGKALYIYDPELEQVMRDRSFDGKELTTAVTFLWGKGKLTEEFNVEFSDRIDLQGKDRVVLEMTPKKAARFTRLTFVVDKKTFAVTETHVEDPGGNINRIIFSHVSTNVGLKDKAFQFTIPEGVDVMDLPDY